MIISRILDIGIEVILFLIASYFLFYKSWLTSLGREVAKLSTVKQLTEITEEVKKDFTEKMEAYKNQLNVELAIKIEPLKAELAKNNIAYQVRFSFLHQESAKAILEIYRKLQELHSAMSDWTASIHPIYADAEKEEEQRRVRANTAINDFKNFFILNKLFFSDSFNDYIEDTFKAYWDLGFDFGYKQRRIKGIDLPVEYFQTYSDEMSKISKEIREVFPLKIKEIEVRCKKILKGEEDTE